MGKNKNRQQKTTRRLLASLLSGRGHRPECLRLLATQPRALVISVIEAEFDSQLRRTWARGWLPSEIMRQVHRATMHDHKEVLRRAVAAHHQKLDPAELHPRWLEHVTNLKLPHVLDDGWMWHLSQDSSWIDFLKLATDTLIASEIDVVLETIIPAPGAELTTESMIKDRVPSGNPILERVRNLLAQAESTNHDAEAEAFTAKAQELMAKHSLNEALVWSRSSSRTEPIVIRIAVDEPYVRAKRYLAHVVAEGSNCRAVFRQYLDLISIIGFEVDVYAAETLFTSLLVQAQSSMLRAAEHAPPGARTRSRGFRSSFLIGYAARISERLAEINAHVAAATTTASGEDLLPVLASRSSAIDKAMNDCFGHITKYSVSEGTDPYGRMAGQQAADLAKLSKRLAA